MAVVGEIPPIERIALTTLCASSGLDWVISAQALTIHYFAMARRRYKSPNPRSSKLARR